MSLEIIKSHALDGIAHGFFTRRGGASSGIYSGLNCGFGSGDQREIVEINRNRAADALGVKTLLGVHQIHSSKVITVTDTNAKRGEADALVTSLPNVGLAVLTADCQPVLFADPGAGVIGAAHAGWKGAMSGVLENTVEAMVALGATRAGIKAVIGPSISQPSYEVGAEFRDRFLEADSSTERYFANGKDNKFHFDLPAYGLSRLKEAGIGHAEATGHCTYTDADRFYSFRRSVHLKEVDYGRLISAIRL